MKPPLKILHVTETAKGGVGSYIDDIAALQIRRDGADSVRVVLPDAHAAQLQAVPLAAQQRFEAGRSRAVTAWRMLRSARAQILQWQPDVVHLHSTFAGMALRPWLALRSPRPAVVYCAHGWAFERDGPALSRRVSEAVERHWARWCDRIVCVSAFDQRAGERIGIPRQRLALIENGTRDVAVPAASAVEKARSAWPTGTRRVLFVGRLDRQKGVDVLFDAMKALGPGSFAVVVGAAVVAQRALALPANVSVAGWLQRDQIAAYYAAADVVLISSRWEGMPLVAVEAMRAGRAVVATAVGGLPDVIDPGVTGLLVPSGQPAALAEAVRSLNADRSAAMGRAGRRRFQQLFRIERVVDELDALYRQILAGHGIGTADGPASRPAKPFVDSVGFGP